MTHSKKCKLMKVRLARSMQNELVVIKTWKCYCEEVSQ
jgi:hypothetical protein